MIFTRIECDIYGYIHIYVYVRDGKITKLAFYRQQPQQFIEFERDRFDQISSFMKMSEIENFRYTTKFEMDIFDHLLKNGVTISALENDNERNRELTHIAMLNPFKLTGKSAKKIEQLFLECAISEKQIRPYHEYINNIIKDIGIYKLSYEKNEPENPYSYCLVVELNNGNNIIVSGNQKYIIISVNLFSKYFTSIPEIVRKVIKYYHNEKNIFFRLQSKIFSCSIDLYDIEYYIDKNEINFSMYYNTSIYFKKILKIIFKHEILCNFLANYNYANGSFVAIRDKMIYYTLYLDRIEDINEILKLPLNNTNYKKETFIFFSSDIQLYDIKRYDIYETKFDNISLGILIDD